jgi:hypothetical protein
MKSNSTPERFERLSAAGFRDVQPGIESFSTPVLKGMDKGVTAIQNVHTLLLGRRHSVHINYNVLYGFPGDEAPEYEEMLRLLPRLYHLDPPVTNPAVLITRFAPLQTSPNTFGIPEASYDPAYELVFSPQFLRESDFHLDRYCYYFARPFENSPRLERLYAELRRTVYKWQELHAQRPVELAYRRDGETTFVRDSRVDADGLEIRLDPIASVVLERAAQPIRRSRLAEALHGEHPVNAVEVALDLLESEGLIFTDGDAVLALPLPADVYAREQTPQRLWAAV